MAGPSMAVSPNANSNHHNDDQLPYSSASRRLTLIVKLKPIKHRADQYAITDASSKRQTVCKSSADIITIPMR